MGGNLEEYQRIYGVPLLNVWNGEGETIVRQGFEEFAVCDSCGEEWSGMVYWVADSPRCYACNERYFNSFVAQCSVAEEAEA